MKTAPAPAAELLEALERVTAIVATRVSDRHACIRCFETARDAIAKAKQSFDFDQEETG